MMTRLFNPAIRIFFSLCVLFAPGITSEAAAEVSAAKPAEVPIKVVYHADFADPRRFSAMLTNIHNMVSTYQAELTDYDVRIVFVSHGIRFVTPDKLATAHCLFRARQS